MVLDVALRRVTRVFDGVPAITQVSLDVARGERVWLRGSNGSGKSTLLQVLATALSPTLGGGEVLGFDLVRERTQVRAHTELLGHQARLYRELSAVENLRFTCTLYGADPSRIPAALEQVGLDEVAHLRTGRYSQGMRQRLALARCLVRDPQLLLLDEPYAGLDVDARTVVDGVLDHAARRSRTVVLASHEEPTPGTVDRVVVMDAGRVAPSEGVLR
jgi:ABC-type multidrug transport system ATPase subunit